jgi:hypothetical protein
MAATPEGKVKEAIKKYLTKRGVWFAGKAPPPVIVGWMYMPLAGPLGVSGIPDFVGVFKGRAFFIEAKAPGGRPTEVQLLRHKEITMAGGVVIVAHSVEELEAEMDKNDL